jgi:hypothetical protein
MEPFAKRYAPMSSQSGGERASQKKSWLPWLASLLVLCIAVWAAISLIEVDQIIPRSAVVHRHARASHSQVSAERTRIVDLILLSRQRAPSELESIAKRVDVYAS